MKKNEVLKVQKEHGAEKAIEMVINATPERCEDFDYWEMVYKLNEMWAEEYHPNFEFTKNLINGGFHGMGDIALALDEIAWHTGYNIEYVNDVFDSYEDGTPYIERIVEISDVACEHDL